MIKLKDKKKIDEILKIILKRNITLGKHELSYLDLGKLPESLVSLDLILSNLSDELIEYGLQGNSEPNEYGLRVEELISLVVVKRIEVTDREE